MPVYISFLGSELVGFVELGSAALVVGSDIPDIDARSAPTVSSPRSKRFALQQPQGSTRWMATATARGYELASHTECLRAHGLVA